MKKIMTASCILCVVLTCSETISAQDRKLKFGLDLTSALKGWSEFVFGYRISDKWTMEAAAGYNFGQLMKKKKGDYVNHHMEFDDNAYEIPEFKGMHMGRIWVSYWPGQAFRGVSMSLGMVYMENRGTDGFCGIGYRLPICKGLGTEFLYTIRLLEAFGADRSLKGEICINLSYIF